MKKIANKIVLLTVLPMMIIIGTFSFVSYRFTRSRIIELTDNLIYESTSSWRHQFESYFANKEVAIDIFKVYIQEHITLDDLKDAERLDQRFQDLLILSTPIIEGLHYLNIYFWLDPQYTSPTLMEFSHRDMKQNGNLELVTDNLYTHDEITGPNWAWFTTPFERGEYITDPYDWEGFDEKLISYTKSVVIEGKTVGVVGSDMYIGELNSRLLAGKFLEKGHYVLLNSDLNVLVHPDGRLGENWKDLFPENSEENMKILRDVSQKEGILFSDNSRIGFNRMENGWIILTVPNVEELFQSLNRIGFLYILILAIALPGIIAVSLFLARSISHPIHMTTEILKDISRGEGDLTKRIILSSMRKQAQEDEVGRLARYFNIFIEDLSSIISDLKGISLSNRDMGDRLAVNTTEISSSSTEITATTQSISDQVNLLSRKISDSAVNVRDIKEQIDHVNASIDNESAFINQSSAAITQMVASIQNLTRISEEKKGVIDDLAEHAHSSSDAMGETAREIVDIAESMGSILELVNVINDVSDRINLLSMNAAIEAAHAGDAGKGFAVVADEIRKLAETTNEQSTRITASVHNIAEKITQAGGRSKNSEESIRLINSNIQQISDTIGELVQGMNEISEGSARL